MKIEFKSNDGDVKVVNINEANQHIIFSSNDFDIKKSILFIDNKKVISSEDKFSVEYIDFKIIATETKIVEENKDYFADWEATFALQGGWDNIFSEDFAMRNFFSPHARKFVIGDRFFLLLSYFNQSPRDTSFFVGSLTILSYRFMEKPELRQPIFDMVVDERINVRLTDTPSLPLVRWMVSSAATISVILMSKNENEKSKLIMQSLPKFYPFLDKVPMIAQNYYSAMILDLCIKIEGNEITPAEIDATARVLFEEISNSILRIYSFKNAWVISQIKDCQILLDIGACVLILKHTYGDMNNEWVVKKDTISRFTFRKFLYRFDKSILESEFYSAFEKKVNNDYLTH